ncbi:MAG: hypothetical protein E2P02_25770 [Acidobacteria bacterium]|nr:MAG: hypothetical protein E2P02_25770 [Acidobacteriota bacterium]
MNDLPLTVLVHDGPMARAYLAALRAAELRPERILLLVYDRHPSTGKPVGRFLPGSLRAAYAERVQSRAFFHWPRFLRTTRPKLYAGMVEKIGETLDLSADVFEELIGETPLEAFTDRLERLRVSGLKDPALTEALSGNGPMAVLFTGGGILRENLLELPGVRFLHIHPGFLPHVRGADGLLWSSLVRGRPGASCFYMEAGLDTGALVLAEEFPRITFPRSLTDSLDDAMLYRALFSFYDPVLRAKMLTNVLHAEADPLNLPAEPQDTSVGVTYHFMGPAVRKAALAELFC